MLVITPADSKTHQDENKIKTLRFIHLLLAVSIYIIMFSADCFLRCRTCSSVSCLTVRSPTCVWFEWVCLQSVTVFSLLYLIILRNVYHLIVVLCNCCFLILNKTLCTSHFLEKRKQGTKKCQTTKTSSYLFFPNSYSITMLHHEHQESKFDSSSVCSWVLSNITMNHVCFLINTIYRKERLHCCKQLSLITIFTRSTSSVLVFFLSRGQTRHWQKCIMGLEWAQYES